LISKGAKNQVPNLRR